MTELTFYIPADKYLDVRHLLPVSYTEVFGFGMYLGESELVVVLTVIDTLEWVLGFATDIAEALLDTGEQEVFYTTNPVDVYRVTR